MAANRKCFTCKGEGSIRIRAKMGGVVRESAIKCESCGWMTRRIQRLINKKTPQQMTLAELAIIAKPIATGLASLGFTANAGSSIAREFLKLMEGNNAR